jgi:predicted NUDIX family phosphoesterase
MSLSPSSESVLVVRKSFLSRQESIPASGFQNAANSRLTQSIIDEGFFVPRQDAEHCADLKQIILYLVLRYRQSLFVYQRVNATTETRLMHMYSIGLGGHINPLEGAATGTIMVNHDGSNLFSANLHRELTEEVQFKGHFSYHLVGTVNDDLSEVGRYHLGLVYLVTCTTPEISVRETEKLTGALLPTSGVAAYLPFMETWSALILPDVCRMIV